MALTPSQILSANRRIFGGTSGGFSSLYARPAQQADPLDTLLDEEAAPDTEKRSPSILERVKGTLAGAIEPVGRTLDMARAGTVAGAVELGDVLRSAAGKDGFGPSGGASLDDLRYNFNRRIGVGDVLEENTLTKGLPLNVKRGVGLVGDIAIDPLNAVTLGAGTAAKTGIRRIAAHAGDDIAEIATREGLDAAEQALAAKIAADPKSVGEGVTTISDLLGERVGRAVAATGSGGVRFAGRQVPGLTGERLGQIGNVLGKPGRRLGATDLGSEVLAPFSQIRQAARQAFIPGTVTRDAFGSKVADAMPGIMRRRAAQVDIATQALDREIAPLLDAVSAEDLGVITSALDVNGSGLNAIADLADRPEAQRLLRALVEAQETAYDTLIAAGKTEDQLMGRTEYLRHKLTEAGAERLGIKSNKLRQTGPRSGNLKQRKLVGGEELGDRILVEGTIKEKNAALGLAAYVDDPVELTRLSLRYSQEVGGNQMAAEALADYAKRIAGLDPKTVFSKSAKRGFTQVGPKAWIPDEIASDWFALNREGMDSVFLQHYDAFSNAVKRQTLFNPISAGPYMAQNAGTGIAMNAVDGARPFDYVRISSLVHKAHKVVDQVGEKGLYDELAKTLDADDLALVKELRDGGHLAPGAKDFAADFLSTGPGPLARKTGPVRKHVNLKTGTVKTARANQHLEEVLRGVSYVAAKRQGLNSVEASAHVLRRHLDYTNLGKTKFERNVVNRFVFFPTWLLKAPTAIVRAYSHTPGLGLAQARLEMGTHGYERETNPFGEMIGPRVSGPMSFLASLSHDVAGEPVELLNPIAQAFFDKDSRHVTNIVPPLANVMSRPGSPVGGGRLGGVIEDDERRARYLRSLGGVRTGVDYETDSGRIRFEQSLLTRQAEREAQAAAGETVKPETTEKIRLTEAAVEAGVEKPYSMTNGQLARALIERGLSRSEVREIVEGE